VAMRPPSGSVPIGLSRPANGALTAPVQCLRAVLQTACDRVPDPRAARSRRRDRLDPARRPEATCAARALADPRARGASERSDRRGALGRAAAEDSDDLAPELCRPAAKGASEGRPPDEGARLPPPDRAGPTRPRPLRTTRCGLEGTERQGA